eukprot:4079802-Amphidinium_carterae.1
MPPVRKKPVARPKPKAKAKAGATSRSSNVRSKAKAKASAKKTASNLTGAPLAAFEGEGGASLLRAGALPGGAGTGLFEPANQGDEPYVEPHMPSSQDLVGNRLLEAAGLKPLECGQGDLGTMPEPTMPIGGGSPGLACTDVAEARADRVAALKQRLLDKRSLQKGKEKGKA